MGKIYTTKILLALLISIFLFNGLQAQEIDLDEISAGDMRNNLRPVFSVLSCHHELPFAAAFFNSARRIVFSGNILNGYGIFGDDEKGMLMSSFWGGFVASPNLSLFMQLSHGKYQQENIATFGPVINFIWGEATRKNVINVSINHLRGPDDFRAKDIALSLAREKELGSLRIFYGLESHYVNAVIDVKATGIKKSINETLYHLRAGVYKSIMDFDLGIEMSVSQESLIGKLNITKII
ncbi:MAG: hypothetical protein ACLFQM_10935 [Fidelibacterota bacterium]